MSIRLFSFSSTGKQLIMGIFSVFFFASAVCLFFTDKPIFYVKGLLLGCVFSALKVMLLERTINRVVSMPSGKARLYSSLHFMLRYALTGFMLAAAAISKDVSLIGAIIGLLSLQFSAYGVNILSKNKENKGVDERNDI